MKLRSGRSLSNEPSSVALTPKNRTRKSKLEIEKKTCIVKQRNKYLHCTSDSSSESASSDSSGETLSVSPKPTPRKKSSKVVPLKKYTIRGVGTPHKKPTRQACTTQSYVDNDIIVSLGDDLKSLNISACENTVKHVPESKHINKVGKHRSKLLKESLYENNLPPKQTYSPDIFKGDHVKSLCSTDNKNIKRLSQEVKLVNETHEARGNVCEELPDIFQKFTAKVAPNDIFNPRLPSKSRQLVPTHSKKLLAGTVKCATSVKTLVTKTLSGNSCKVIPVVYIETSSSSEDESTDRNIDCENVEIKAEVIDVKNSTSVSEVYNDRIKPEGYGVPERNKSILNSGKLEERDICTLELKKNYDQKNEATDVLNSKENNVPKLGKSDVPETEKDHVLNIGIPLKSAENTPEHTQGENACSLTKSEVITHSASSVNTVGNTNLVARQIQPLLGIRTSSGILNHQISNDYFPVNKETHQSSQCFPRNNWNSSQPSYQYCRNRPMWEMASGNWGDHRSPEFKRTRRMKARWHNRHRKAEQTYRAPATAESYVRKTPQLLHDYNRLGNALCQSTAMGFDNNYYVQHSRLPTSHFGAHTAGDGQRLNAGTGMQNPISVFGGNVYLPSSQPIQKQGLRPIIIDGSNVAMGHGGNCHFSYRGLQICVDYFVRRGHKVITFLPQHRKCGLAAKDRLVLQQLEKGGHVVFTPSRRVDNRLVVPYDDWYIVQCAAVLEGVIVSNDNYRDLLSEDAEVARAIKERLLMYTWVDNLLMFPKDPLGRGGPSLDQFLRFPTS